MDIKKNKSLTAIRRTKWSHARDGAIPFDRVRRMFSDMPVKLQPNGDDEVNFTLNIVLNPKEYVSTTHPKYTLENADKQMNRVDFVDLEKPPLTAYDEALLKAMDRFDDIDHSYHGVEEEGIARAECEASLEECRAKNKLACPYHGAKLLQLDIQKAFAKQGIRIEVKITPYFFDDLDRRMDYDVNEDDEENEDQKYYGRKGYKVEGVFLNEEKSLLNARRAIEEILLLKGVDLVTPATREVDYEDDESSSHLESDKNGVHGNIDVTSLDDPDNEDAREELKQISAL